jgi:transcriptional regulator with XRE-family HTH domain
VVSNEQRRVFARALARARKARGLSQSDVARAVGVTASAVSLWEADETSPRPEIVAKLEAVLGLEDGELTRLLGYLPLGVQREATMSVIAALEADPSLTDEQRDLLAALYRQLTGKTDAQDEGSG